MYAIALTAEQAALLLEILSEPIATVTAERNAAVADLREIENRLHDVLAIDVRTIPNER